MKIPGVFVEFSSRTILTTEWIFGEKFTEARFVDPRSSCRTLLNCYLTQLLNVGYLHADPHPGNLICTNEGKLCLLDFGLVAEVTEQQRYALIEFITHLWMEDWDAIAVDLEHLQFLPEGSTEEANAELREVLQKIFGDMVHGDGLRVNKITRELDQAAREHQIVIPSYFTLILRAFCIVEGLCIESTGGFSIVQVSHFVHCVYDLDVWRRNVLLILPDACCKMTMNGCMVCCNLFSTLRMEDSIWNVFGVCCKQQETQMETQVYPVLL